MASHYRAASDMGVKWANSKNRYCNVEIDDYFPGAGDRRAFMDFLRAGKSKLTEDCLWGKIETWLSHKLS